MKNKDVLTKSHLEAYPLQRVCIVTAEASSDFIRINLKASLCASQRRT